MYYRLFFSRLITLLKQMGFANVEYPYEGCYYIEVAGCTFSADLARGNRGTIKFEGWYFRYSERDRGYTPKAILQAARLIVDELPKKLEEVKRQKERSKKIQEVTSINKALSATKCLTVYADDDVFYLNFRHAEKLTVMAAADWLQEGGFCQDDPPTIDKEKFTEEQRDRTLNTIDKLLRSLPTEIRINLLRDLAEGNGLIKG